MSTIELLLTIYIILTFIFNFLSMKHRLKVESYEKLIFNRDKTIRKLQHEKDHQLDRVVELQQLVSMNIKKAGYDCIMVRLNDDGEKYFIFEKKGESDEKK